MKFLVIGRAIDSLPVPAPQAVEAFRASFELFVAGKIPQIEAVYPYADERATAFVIEASSGDELGTVLMSIPGYFLSTWESHPIQSPQSVVDALAETAAATATR